ncbi:MAG TPA: DUF1080 domain-containing protein [Gemmatimonadales bacterium]
MTTTARILWTFLGLGICVRDLAAQQPVEPPVTGRWDITVATPSGGYPSWLEMQWSGDRTLVGRFVGRFGSSRPISKLEFSHDTLRFSIPPQWEQGDADLHFEAVLADDRLSGWMTDANGERLTWSARRAPTLRRATAPAWGRAHTIFNGVDLAGWTPSGPNSRWKVVDHVLSNAGAGANLATRDSFVDFRLHLEFRYPAGGNSGIYLRGRYEVQVEDTPGAEPKNDGLGSIYGFLLPSENAAKRPGEWQSYDITLVGRLVTVVLNGRRIICEQPIPGITGGALDSHEEAPGPIYLQGDHGPIEYRNIVLTPASHRRP